MPDPDTEHTLMTQFPDLFAALAAAFEINEVKVFSKGGRELRYITARTAMNRLDDVLGPENWWDLYQPGDNSVMCMLTIRLPDGQCVTKCDAGGYAGMPDSGDDDKSGVSDAFKRAAAKFGVARYLYRDGVPSFVRDREPDTANAAARPSQGQRTQTTDADSPLKGQNPNGDNGRTGTGSGGTGNGHNGPPKTGRALFAWVKEMEREYQFGLLKALNAWGKDQEFALRMVDWNQDEVQLAYAEGVRRLKAVKARGDAYE
jgi:hypothetical protein